LIQDFAVAFGFLTLLFDIDLAFACLRGAASAKAGILKFDIFSVG